MRSIHAATVNVQRPGAVDGERAAPAVVPERLERRLAPAPRARARGSGRRAEHVVARRGRSSPETTTSSPTTRLTGKRPQSTCGSTSLDLDRRAADLCARRAMGVRLSQVDETQTRQRSPAASDVAARRPARRGGVPLRRLARGGRPVVVAGAAARPARRRRLAVQRRVGVRRLAALLAEPRARVTAAEVEDFVARHPFWTRRLGSLRRQGRARRPGSLRARVERAARLRARARRAHLRRHADLRRRRQRRARRAPRALPRRRGRRRAARRATRRRGQHWGNPLYDWRAHRATGYRWWIERFRRTFELVDLARIDHFRGFVAYWAIPERHRTAAARPLAYRARAPSPSTRRAPRSASCRSSRRTSA